MKFTLVIILSLLFSSIILAQNNLGRIYGKVIDKFTQQPLPGANVLILNTQNGSAADLNGRFEILNVDPGEYQVKASIIGYTSSIKTDVVVVVGFPAEIIFELSEAAIELEKVVVQDGYFETDRIEISSTRNFSNEEIRRSPGGFEDVIRALSVLPGVAQVSAGRNDLIIRGGAPSENLYLIDGFPVSNINHFGSQGATGGPLSYVNLDFIRSTTFSTGGFSVRYGDKLSSTLAIALRNGRDDRIGGKATISASQFGLDLEGPISDNSQVIISARRSYLDFIFKAADFSFVPEYWDVMGKLNFDFNSGNNLSFLFITAIDNISYDNETADQRYDNSQIIGSEQLQFLAGIKYRHLIKNGFINFSLSSNYIDFDTIQRDSLLTPVYINKSKEIENTLKTELVYKLSKASDITVGGDVKLIDFETEILLPAYTTTFGDSLNGTDVDTSAVYYKGSVYLNFNSILFDKFNVNIGVRGDYFNVLEKKFYFSPRFSISYMINELTTLNFSSGVYHQSPAYLWLVGDKNNSKLKNIRVNQFIVGIDRYLSSDALLKLEAFYKDYSAYPASLKRRYLILSNTGAGFADENYQSFGLEPLVSGGSGKSKGLELSIQKKLSETPYYGILSLTYSMADYTPLNGITLTGSYDQTWLLSLSGGYKFSNEWEGSLKFRYSTGQPYSPYKIDGTQDVASFNTIRFTDSHSLDIRVDKKWFFEDWSLITYIDIQNIYNRKNISGVRWDDRTQSPEFNESFGILPSIGVSAVF